VPLYHNSASGLFCRFVYQVVVPKVLAPKELVKVLESGDKVVLPPWDPMVSFEFVSRVISLIKCIPQGSLA
jgi:aminopeptidase C